MIHSWFCFLGKTRRWKITHSAETPFPDQSFHCPTLFLTSALCLIAVGVDGELKHAAICKRQFPQRPVIRTISGR
jgi:hypothetical protein